MLKLKTVLKNTLKLHKKSYNMIKNVWLLISYSNHILKLNKM